MKKALLILSILLAPSLLGLAGGEALAQSKIIAHRGYWTSLEQETQNSVASLEAALNLGCYGSETDVWITTDGCMMVNHDPQFNGTVLETSTAAVCQALTLSNGEKMPTLQRLLEVKKASKSPTLLIIEIKTHEDPARGEAAAKEAVRLVKKMKMRKQVEYIAFSFDVCKVLHKADKKAKVAYLNGDKAPAELHAAGITGIDYHMNVLREHPEWIPEAHALGMTVNVWTADSQEDIDEFRALGVDYITTNYPER